MSQDDQAERTVPPTERRRREARARGQVPRSSELTAALVLLAASIAFQFILPTVIDELGMLMRRGLSSAASTSLTISSAAETFGGLGRQIMKTLLPLSGLILLAGLLANVIQTGWLWIPDAILPRLRTGAVFSHDRAIVAGWWIVRFATLAAVTWYFLQTQVWSIVSLSSATPTSMLTQVSQLFGSVTIQLSLCLLFFAAIDYGYRYWRHELNLRMTLEERRQEQRDDEVDSRLKARRTGNQGPVTSAPATSPLEQVAGIVE